MDQFVLDASVGAKLVFNESSSDKALFLLDKVREKTIRIVVPEFFYTEMANICWVRTRRKFCTLNEAADVLERVLKMPLTTYRDRELWDVALENAARLGISVYDALYVSLAEIYFAPLVTADKALVRACRGKFNFIESLEEFAEEKR